MVSLEKQPDNNATPRTPGLNVSAGMVLTNLLLLGLVLALLVDIYVRLSPDRTAVPSRDIVQDSGIKKNQDFPPPFQSQAADSGVENDLAAQQRANQNPSNRRKKLIDERIAPSP
jgi:hypothetical protein